MSFLKFQNNTITFCVVGKQQFKYILIASRIKLIIINFENKWIKKSGCSKFHLLFYSTSIS